MTVLVDKFVCHPADSSWWRGPLVAAAGGTKWDHSEDFLAKLGAPSPLGGMATLAAAAAESRQADTQAALEKGLADGIRSENKLTDLVFWAMHPELNGRKIKEGEQELSREWLAIRNNLVRPALAGKQDVETDAREPAGSGAVR